jgi:replicative DNA helicase
MAETLRYKPDMVGIDFINVMRAPKQYQQMWERLLYIAYELKHNARVTKIPILAAAQGNRQSAREGVTLDTVANSIGIAQASDICIALHQDDDDIEAKKMQIKAIKNRDGKKPQTVMHWDHDIMNIYEITAGDLMRRRTNDENQGGDG